MPESGPTEDEAASLAIRVPDGATGRGLEGLRVELRETPSWDVRVAARQGRTDADGRAAWKGLRPGRYVVRASRARESASVTLEPGKNASVTLEFEGLVAVKGRRRYRSPRRREPLAKARVWAMARDRAPAPGDWGRSAITDVGEVFFLEGLLAQEHDLEVAVSVRPGSVRRRLPRSGLPTVRPGDADLVIVVRSDLLPSVHVLWRLRSGEVDIRDARLLLRRIDDTNRLTNHPTRDPTGDFCFGPFPPGPHRLEVHTASHGVVLLEDREFDLFQDVDLGTVELLTPGRVTLTIHRAAAGESEKVSITVRQGRRRVWFGFSSQDTVDIGPLPPGSHVLSATDGRIGRRARFELASREHEELTVDLR